LLAGGYQTFSLIYKSPWQNLKEKCSYKKFLAIDQAALIFLKSHEKILGLKISSIKGLFSLMYVLFPLFVFIA